MNTWIRMHITRFHSYKILFLVFVFLVKLGKAQVGFIEVNDISQLTNKFVGQGSSQVFFLSSTDGLNIYDGLHTRVYRPSTHHMEGYNVQSNFFEDTLGRVWFTTYEALNYYSPREDELDYTYMVDGAGDTVKANYKAFHLEGSDLYLKAGNQVFIYDVYQERIRENYAIDFAEFHELAYVRLNGDTGVFGAEGGYFELASLHPGGEHTLLCESRDSITSVLSRDDGRLWLGQTKGRISLFDPGSCQYVFTDKIATSAVIGIEVLSQHRLILSISGSHLLEYDIPSRKVIRSIYPVDVQTGVPVYSLLNPYLDQDSTLWVGGDGQGVFFTSLKPKKFAHILGGNFDRRPVSVVRIIPIANQEYLVLSRVNGILRVNLAGDILNHWDVLPVGKKSFTSLNGILLDDRQLLFSSERQLHVLDIRSGHITTLQRSPGTPVVDMEQMERLSNGRIVASCYTDLMMEILLHDHQYTIRPYGAFQPHMTSATYFKVDEQGWIYLSDDEVQLVVLKPADDNKGHEYAYTLSLSGGVKGLIKDPQGDAVYLCNTQGLYHLDRITREVSQVMDKDKWLAQTIYSVLADARGDLWLGTNKGLIRYTPTAELAKAFTKMDGIQENEYNTHACIMQPDGRMFFGGVNGLNYFHPDDVILSKKIAPIVLTDFLVNDEPDSVYQVPDFYPELILPYARNTITFEFHAIDYSNPEATRVKYKLSGVDDHYVESKNMEGYARYANLRPGNYIFSILSANADGVWSDTPREIEVIINPPFWMTWWFITLSILAVGGVIYGSVRSYFKRKLERKNQLLREQALIIEKQQAVEHERTRIASEMHDDLGSGLTTIRYLSDKALLQAKDTGEADQIKRIAEHSNRLVRNMSEIIWAMNSRFDNAENLVGYLRRYASEYLEEHQMPLSFTSADERLDQLTITGEKRRNVFLVFKELLHNAVKYSGAERIDIRIATGDKLEITLSEAGGKGFDPDTSMDKGNGLYNCRKRMETVGGFLTFSKTPDAMNTQIVLPLQPLSHA